MLLSRTRLFVLGSAILLCAPISAQTTITRLTEVPGVEVAGGFMSSLSADGRFVAFSSLSNNLVQGDPDTDGNDIDVFVRDLQTGTTSRATSGSYDAPGFFGSQIDTSRAISADGRFVVFTSVATNIVPGGGNAGSDVYVHDFVAGTTSLVSVTWGGTQGGNGNSSGGSISADGTKVAFHSTAYDLVTGDANSLVPDVFVRDLTLGQTVIASQSSAGIQANYGSGTAEISGDGSSVVFMSSADNLVPGAGPHGEIYVRDLAAGTTTRASVGLGGAAPDDLSRNPSISFDGQRVVFDSFASNLVAGDTNASRDVFLYEVASGTTTRVSVATGGTQGIDGCSFPSISDAGDRVAFRCSASNLVPGDGNGATDDIVVRDLAAGITTLVSLGSQGQAGNSDSVEPSISHDGLRVAFHTLGTSFAPGDSNNGDDVFVRELASNDLDLVSVGLGNVQGNDPSEAPSIAAYGNAVAYATTATNLAPGDVNGVTDVLVCDLATGAHAMASVDAFGNPGDDDSTSPSLSADGRRVAFASFATNLVALDGNFLVDVFVHDLGDGSTVRASVGPGGTQSNGGSAWPSISADGTRVAFESIATNLVTGGTTLKQVFVRDLASGVTSLVSAAGGVQGNDQSYSASISGNGRYVAFTSTATNLVAGDPDLPDVYVRDLLTGSVVRASVSSSGGHANGSSTHPVLSADGRYVAFESGATNLVAGDGNSTGDVFVRDLVNGTTVRASVDSSGLESNGQSETAGLSANGRRVLFGSIATNLAPGSASGQSLYVRDFIAGTTERVVASWSNGGAWEHASMSGDGRLIAFASTKPFLVPGDSNSDSDVFLADRGAGSVMTRMCPGDGIVNQCPCGNNGTIRRGCQNSAGTGGAQLSATGNPSLASDTVVLTSTGELPVAFTIVLQGNQNSAPVSFGDGLRCAGGALKRLYTKNAVGGVVSVPGSGEPSISLRSSQRGDTIPFGGTRIYQTYYRDPNASFCPAPVGSTFNSSSGMMIVWSD